MLRKELIIHYLWWKFKANINQTIIKRKSTLIILFSLLMSIIINCQAACGSRNGLLLIETLQAQSGTLPSVNKNQIRRL